MSKLSVSYFQWAFDSSLQGGEWYGEYNGRGSHQGYAIQVDDHAGLFEIGVIIGREMAESAEHDCAKCDAWMRIANCTPHIDSLGKGLIVSFPKRLFEED